MSAALWLFGKVLVAWLALSAFGLLVWVAVMKCRGGLNWEEPLLWPDTELTDEELHQQQQRRTADLQARLQRKAVGE